MNCPKCTSECRTGAVFCAVCGNSLVPHPTPNLGPYGTMRGVTSGSTGAYALDRNPFIATIASFFFPAGGQIYNGDFKKMGLFWLIFFGCGVLAGTGIFILVAFGVWIWSIIDANRVAKREKPLW